MQSSQSAQQKESELTKSRNCHICLKKQAEKNAACTVSSAEGHVETSTTKHVPIHSLLLQNQKYLISSGLQSLWVEDSF
ncbi:hypothetical protein TB2_032184 [Malus domestica]